MSRSPSSNMSVADDELASYDNQIENLELQRRVLEEQLSEIQPDAPIYANVEIKLRRLAKQLSKVKDARARHLDPQIASFSASSTDVQQVPASIDPKTKFIKQVELHFANRDRERKELKIPKSSRYCYIEAPAGYGKSFLLYQLLKDYEDEGCTVAWVSFDTSVGGDLAKKARSSQRAVLQQMLDSLDIHEAIGNSSEGILSLCKVLTEQSKNKPGKQVVLFFDAIDHAKDQIVEWIENELLASLEQLKTRLRPPRAYFTSRPRA